MQEQEYNQGNPTLRPLFFEGKTRSIEHKKIIQHGTETK